MSSRATEWKAANPEADKAHKRAWWNREARRRRLLREALAEENTDNPETTK